MSSELRVLHVINGLGTGGAERSLSEMIPHLKERGIQSRIVTLHAREEGVEKSIRDLGIRVETLPRSPIGRLQALRGLLVTEPPDVVHTAIFESDMLGRLAAVGTSVPVLTSLVNTSYEPVRLEDPGVGHIRLRGAQVIDRVTSRLTTHFHAISHTVKGSAIRALGIDPHRITVVERGRDPDRLGQPGLERRHRARGLLGIPTDQLVVISVGRQEFQKGHRHLIGAASRVLKRKDSLLFLLAGRSGNASAELSQLHHRLGLGERFRFLGHRDDLPDLLAAADLFVFPSVYEGLGGALIEAMALELPVIASDIPAMREVLDPDRGAILVPAGDPDALADAIGYLLDDPGRRAAFGRWNRQVFLNRFTLELAVAGMAHLYHDVAAMGPRPSAGAS